MENALGIVSGLCIAIGLFTLIFADSASIGIIGIILTVIGSVLGIYLLLMSFTIKQEASYTVVRKEVIDGVCYIDVAPTKKTYRFTPSAEAYVVTEVGDVIN